MKVIGIKINCSIKSEKSFRLMVHISKTLKIEAKPTRIASQNIKISDP